MAAIQWRVSSRATAPIAWTDTPIRLRESSWPYSTDDGTGEDPPLRRVWLGPARACPRVGTPSQADRLGPDRHTAWEPPVWCHCLRDPPPWLDVVASALSHPCPRLFLIPSPSRLPLHTPPSPYFPSQPQPSPLPFPLPPLFRHYGSHLLRRRQLEMQRHQG